MANLPIGWVKDCQFPSCCPYNRASIIPPYALTYQASYLFVIMGATGRDCHHFNLVYRDDPTVEGVAFTAAQASGISDRTYPPSLAGPFG